jgi:hypothetical protein
MGARLDVTCGLRILRLYVSRGQVIWAGIVETADRKRGASRLSPDLPQPSLLSSKSKHLFRSISGWLLKPLASPLRRPITCTLSPGCATGDWLVCAARERNGFLSILEQIRGRYRFVFPSRQASFWWLGPTSRQIGEICNNIKIKGDGRECPSYACR